MFLTLGLCKLSSLFRSGETSPCSFCLNFLPRNISELKCCGFLLTNFISWVQAPANELFIQPLVVFCPQKRDTSQNLKCGYISECFWKLAAGQSKKHSQQGKERLKQTWLPLMEHWPWQLPSSYSHPHTPEQSLRACTYPCRPHPQSWREGKEAKETTAWDGKRRGWRWSAGGMPRYFLLSPNTHSAWRFICKSKIWAMKMQKEIFLSVRPTGPICVFSFCESSGFWSHDPLIHCNLGILRSDQNEFLLKSWFSLTFVLQILYVTQSNKIGIVNTMYASVILNKMSPKLQSNILRVQREGCPLMQLALITILLCHSLIFK